MMEAMQVIDQLVKRLSSAARTIQLSSDLFANICTFLRSDPLFEQDEVQQLVESLCSFRKQPGRQLSAQVLIVMLAILRRSTEGTATDRGLSTLIDILNDEDQIATVTQASVRSTASGTGTANSRKARIGKHVMSDLVRYFLGLQHSARKRRQVGLLILELIHECVANQSLLDKESTDTKSLFFELLANETDNAIRVTAALIYRELQLSGIDLTGFCHSKEAESAMPPSFRNALNTATSDPTETSARLAWALNFLQEIGPVVGSFKQESLPLLRGVSCEFNGENDELDLDASDGRALAIFGHDLTIMIYNNQDSIPYLVDIPVGGISEVKKGRRPLSRAQATVVKLRDGTDSTIYIDGEGHRSDLLYLIDASSPSKLPALMRTFHQRARQGQNRSSQALSPVNLSIAAWHDTSVQRKLIHPQHTAAETGSSAQRHQPQSDFAPRSKEVDGDDPVPDSSQPKSNALRATFDLQASTRPTDEHKAPSNGKLTYDQPLRGPRAKGQDNRRRISNTDTVFEFPPADDEKSSKRRQDISITRHKQVITTLNARDNESGSHLPQHVQNKLKSRDSALQPKLNAGSVVNRTSRPMRSTKTEATKKMRKSSVTDESGQGGDNHDFAMLPPPLRGRAVLETETPFQQITPASLESHDESRASDSKASGLTAPHKVQTEPPPLLISRGVQMAGKLVEQAENDPGSLELQAQTLRKRTLHPNGIAGEPKKSTSPEIGFTPKGKLAGSLQPPGTDRVARIRPNNQGHPGKAPVRFDEGQQREALVLAKNPRTPKRGPTSSRGFLGHSIGAEASKPIPISSEDEERDSGDETEDVIDTRSLDRADIREADEPQLERNRLAPIVPNAVPTKTLLHRNHNISHELRSEKKPWRNLAKQPNRTHGTTKVDSPPTPALQIRVNPEASDKDDLDPPFEDADLVGDRLDQGSFEHPWPTLPLTQVTETGSPLGLTDRENCSQTLDEQLHYYPKHSWNELSNPRHNEEVDRLRDRGRRISQRMHGGGLDRDLQSQSHHSVPNRTDNKAPTNFTPHGVEVDGFLNLRTDQMVRSTIIHNPFAEPRVVENAARHCVTSKAHASTDMIPDYTRNISGSQRQVYSMTGNNNAEQPIEKAVRFAATQKRGNDVEFVADSAKTVNNKLSNDFIQIVRHPNSKQFIPNEALMTGAREGHKGAAIERERKQEPSFKPLVSLKLQKARDTALSVENHSSKRHRTRKRPSALIEDESGDGNGWANRRAKRGKQHAHSRKREPDNFSPNSSSSSSSHSSHSWEDPDKTLFSSEDEGEDALSPAEELQLTFIKFAESLMSPFISLENAAEDLVGTFASRATQMVSEMLETKAATESDRQNRSAKAKKRLGDNLVKAEHAMKRQRVESEAKLDRLWKDRNDQALLIGRSCLEAFA